MPAHHRFERARRVVLDRIANGVVWEEAHEISTYTVGQNRIHMRVVSNPLQGSVFAFNINNNTLRATHEVWICAHTERYYLIPVSEIREMYADADAYVDEHNPTLKVVHVDLRDHRVRYSRTARLKDFTAYFRGVLKWPAAS
jgi:hypothetical protein